MTALPTALVERPAKAMIFDDVVRARHAVRNFHDTPVPTAVVREILDVARFAPSGSNIQPWKCYVLTGAARDRLCTAAATAFRANPMAQESEYGFYPQVLPEPCLSHRAAFGQKFGNAYGVAQDDMPARLEVGARNFLFFGAPVGLIFTIDGRLERASFIDYGCFLQTIMLAAKSRGLDTCAQQTWAMVHPVIRAELSLPDEEMVVCGMSLGHANKRAPENNLGLDKATVDDFAVFLESDQLAAAA